MRIRDYLRALARAVTRSFTENARLTAIGATTPLSNTNIHRLHGEVNDLKHTPQGLYGGRNVTYPQAVAAVDELLELFEAWPDLH